MYIITMHPDRYERNKTGSNEINCYKLNRTFKKWGGVCGSPIYDFNDNFPRQNSYFLKETI